MKWIILDANTETQVGTVEVPANKTNIEQVQYVRECVLHNNYEYQYISCVCQSVFRGEISSFIIVIPKKPIRE